MAPRRRASAARRNTVKASGATPSRANTAAGRASGGWLRGSLRSVRRIIGFRYSISKAKGLRPLDPRRRAADVVSATRRESSVRAIPRLWPAGAQQMPISEQIKRGLAPTAPAGSGGGAPGLFPFSRSGVSYPLGGKGMTDAARAGRAALSRSAGPGAGLDHDLAKRAHGARHRSRDGRHLDPPRHALGRDRGARRAFAARRRA